MDDILNKVSNVTIKVIIESRLAYLPLLRKTIRGICSNVVQDESVLQAIDLSLNEALCNVIYHSYQNEPDHEIQIMVTLYPQEVVFQIIDLGLKNLKNYKPVSFPIDKENIDALDESGRGIYLIHQLMDEVTYTSEKDRNVLLLRKRFK